MKTSRQFEWILVAFIAASACDGPAAPGPSRLPAQSRGPWPAALITQTGTIVEPGVGPVPDATVRFEVVTAEPWETTTDATGRYELRGLVAQQGEMRLSKEGYEPSTLWMTPIGGRPRDFSMQRIVRISAGDSLEAIVFPDDPEWLVNSTPSFKSFCKPCRLIRIRTAAGRLTTRVLLKDSSELGAVWIGQDRNALTGVCCGGMRGVELTYDVTDPGFDVLLLIQWDTTAPGPQRVRIETTLMPIS